MTTITSTNYTINFNKTGNSFVGKDGNQYEEYSYSVEFKNLPLENYTSTSSYDVNDDAAFLIEDSVSTQVAHHQREEEIRNMPADEYAALYIDEDGNDTRY